MAITNHDRITRAMDSLRAGLAPFVVREFEARFKERADEEARQFMREDRMREGKPVEQWDVAPLLKLMWEAWNRVFRDTLGHAERSLVSELRAVRNRWAHQDTFSSDDAYRALDSSARLLSAVSAPEVEAVEKMKQELLRVRFDEQARGEKRKQLRSLIDSPASATLVPWREVITPHPDVASGNYQQAEFAADLWQVHLGEASAEYQDPAEFFRRTFLTESLKGLLVGAVQRIAGQGGDPVVQLQTNFGGGKTHSMLALYHLFSGTEPAKLPNVDGLLAEADAPAPQPARRVVLVGNRISPGNPAKKPGGTVVRTLWGELAWQLGHARGGTKEAKKAFARVAADDENATSPGDVLRELLVHYGPSLILIDEWVAYARQLHDASDLPAGSFETQFTFAQALTESAKLAKNCLLVVSLPASDTSGSPHATSEDVEVGGVRGREALDRLRNVVGRLESSWRPASAAEGFEIVRRRLFEPMQDTDVYKQRDMVARAFVDMYRKQKAEFPGEASDAEYEKRVRSAYPIHPEIFERLYSDWSTLIKFQRTRGVLRLMAAVIHSLWENGDRNPLILPATIPIDDTRVRSELTRYLSDNWEPVIEKDVDGANSLPLRIDADVPNLGKLNACRRVARAIYLGSAPIQTAAHQGIEDRRVRLGCAMPGEAVAVFGDALRRLSSSATYLYQDGTRYWYSTQPTVLKLAEDRAAQLEREPERVVGELAHRLRENLRQRGDFARIHTLPQTSADVPDDATARLVVLGIDCPYSKDPDNPAIEAARSLLETRGTSPRIYRNTLVFLAVDRARLQDLDEAIRRFLAWESIVAEADTLDLTSFQTRQAQTQKGAADTGVSAKIPEAYQWLLVPTQKAPDAPVTWEAIRLSGQDALALRAGKKLRSKEELLQALGPTMLRHEIDRVPLWRGNHVEIRQLIEDFARYLYLPRVAGPGVVAKAVVAGVELLSWHRETFAYADGFDEAANRYAGLRGGVNLSLPAEDPPGMIVKPDVGSEQMQKEAQTAAEGDGTPAGGGAETAVVGDPSPGTAPPNAPKPAPRPRRYYGEVSLDPLRAGRDASRIAEEIIAHLAGLANADVKVSLEIRAVVPDGMPEQVVRTVSENSATLKFENFEFGEE